MNSDIRVLGICGSLRKASHNMAALRAAGENMPAGMTLTIVPITGIPVYNADDQASGWPQAVQQLGEAIRAADAVLIASPEYNFTIPGGLKNALDWVSRLPNQPFGQKPVALMGASAGKLGTSRMQYDLRKCLQFLDAFVLNKPEVFIGGAAECFDSAGVLTHAGTRAVLTDQMLALHGWVRRLRPVQQVAATA